MPRCGGVATTIWTWGPSRRSMRGFHTCDTLFPCVSFRALGGDLAAS